MADTQDSVEILLKKARERRARNQKAESALLQREKTGAEKMCVQSIASGIRSPTTARKTYNPTNTGIGMGVGKGVAGGVKGAKAAPVREVKAVPLDEIEDDFECLQERMRNRFKQNSPDFKENLLSPNTLASGTKRTFFDNPSTDNKRTPLSPSRQTNVLSPTKKFFPDVKTEETAEPTPPKRTTSRMGQKDFKYSTQPKNIEALKSSDPLPKQAENIAVTSPVKQASSPVKRSDSTYRTGSPVKQESSTSVPASNNLGSPVKRADSLKRPDSPLKRSDSINRSPAKKHAPVKITSSFRSRGSPVTDSSPKKAPQSPKGGGLKTMPSIRVKPNSIVSRALAKLQNSCSDTEDSDVEDDTPLPEPVKVVATPSSREVIQKEEAPQSDNEDKKEATPGRSNTTVDDSLFIKNNMAQVQLDLDAMKSDIIKEESEHETSQESGDSVSYDESREEAQLEPVSKMNIEPEPVKNEPAREVEQSMKTDDSLEDLCNDVMPSPTKEEADETEDSEWMDFSPDVRDKQNTSLKRDADCLAESVLGSVESFISCDLTTTPRVSKQTPSDEGPKALSPVQPVKKLRRSMSVSDIPSKSPARFVRLDHLRSSSSSLQSRNYGSQSSKTSSSSTSRGSGYYSYNSSQEEVTPVKKPKSNSYKGPLEEGTLELRPPFEQVKVLEQGIMVQKELESQATQLIEHCQYGLEQVEAEKLLLVAGLKKNLWKYHLAEVKDEKHIFSNAELPKGYLEIKGISLLLRQDYLVNKVVETKKNQAFFVAVKVSPYRLLTTNIATSECNIHGTNLNITDTIVIDNLPPDYKITLEVYCMSYNMMNNATPARKTSKVANTPKKLLQNALQKMGSQKNKTGQPFASSMESYSRSGSTTPRGGSTSSRGGAKVNQDNKFVLAGSLNLAIKDAKKEQFRLRRAPFHSPFEGTINLSMTAKEAISSQPPSHKGFLTIFQDESGLGAWNRRWCSVQDNKIYYWLYPEDEVNQNKQPHGEIDLRNCKTETVSIASRLDCARPNTFVLVIMQAAQPGDRASIITESNGKTTQTKYLLSADSREERKQWMEVLNKCLQSVISWNH